MTGPDPDGGTEDRPRVLRRRTGAVVAGVAGGLADHLGVEVFRVRLVLTALCALGGTGVLAYAALWAFCPLESRAAALRAVGERERWQGFGLVVLGIGLALLLTTVGGGVGWIVGPLGVALVGAAVVWREADTADATDSRAGRSMFAPRALVAGRVGLLRAVLGVVLLVVGIVAFLLGSLDVGQLQFGLLAALATLVGVAVLTVPWWLRLARELSAERRARIRGQERAEIAAHLHDSVLQTLALIQKQPGGDDGAREVRRLARRQERELRSWLHDRSGAPDDGVTHDDPPPATVVVALTTAAAEVEDDHGVRVAPVVVGDAPLTEAGAALVAAAREAMVNAAKHSGVDEISVYAEAQSDELAVFVRDRGAGFDPDAVPADRQGLAGSVHARMARHGGRVRLRSTIGEGTEVGLTVPHAPQAMSTEGGR